MLGAYNADGEPDKEPLKPVDGVNRTEIDELASIVNDLKLESDNKGE